ncbi:hypothetical protein [Candidatus Nanosyncoccus alces]|uniref:ATP-cone domain-containing protein n=1 Tax=Candidatus Nanosyncoccus alces TaxID=2171997 RepID=A0ABY0FNK6_9BACT|nr:hypothetical protein [Candidatus Nanosyncoccus alces]RYC74803.1 hypothetical protein G3RUM_00350 [Candidatus Nanosyncoccus alces]
MEITNNKTLIKNLKIDAKAIGIPTGAAEIFINKSLTAAQKSLKSKKIITDQDLKLAIVKELRKYNTDFAYVYENHDKII